METHSDINLDNLGFWENVLLKIKQFFYFIKNFFFKSVNTEEKKNLFDFQNRVKEKILKSIKNNKKIMIVHMPTGSGKTRTTISSLIELIRSSNDYTAIWLAHTDELCEQAIETIENLWKIEGKGKLKITRLDKNFNLEFEDGYNFVVSTYQKLSSMRTGSERNVDFLERMRRKLNLIISDEAHMLPAETFNNSKILDNIDGTFIIGLSATPGECK